MLLYGRFTLALLSLLWVAIAPAHACGRERWPAKTLADGSWFAQNIIPANIEDLRTVPRPFGVDGMDAPRVASERRFYHIHGELLGFKLESDGDVHAIIAPAGHTGETMIAEIPNPKCMHGAPAAYVHDVEETRLAFVKRYGIPPVRTFRLAYQRIDLTGALFFDFGHDQDGAAPNQAEIHPVIGIGTSSVVAPIAAARESTPTAGASTEGCAGDVRVWINLRSGVYHLPGSRWYGNTRRGEYLCKRQADASGYRAAANGE